MKWALLVVFCDRFLQINSQPPPGVSLPLDTSGISRDGELTYVKTFNGKNTWFCCLRAILKSESFLWTVFRLHLRNSNFCNCGLAWPGYGLFSHRLCNGAAWLLVHSARGKDLVRHNPRFKVQGRFVLSQAEKKFVRFEGFRPSEILLVTGWDYCLPSMKMANPYYPPGGSTMPQSSVPSPRASTTRAPSYISTPTPFPTVNYATNIKTQLGCTCKLRSFVTAPVLGLHNTYSHRYRVEL